MKRVLFVDDEPRVLEGLENLLFDYADVWELAFACSGAEALEYLEREPVDVLVTDMRMPGMDGAELLRQVKALHPEIVRIVLSGHADVEPALRAMPVSHQFLSKPCSAAQIVGVLERACRVEELVNDAALRAEIGKLGDLPTRPAVASDLARLAADDMAPIETFAAVIERDVAVATKVLKIANTAFFSRGAQIRSIQQAVMRLGLRFIQDLVMCVEVFATTSATRRAEIDRLNRHCFLAGSIAKRVLADADSADLAFAAGTLHGVGDLVQLTSPPHVSIEVEANAIGAYLLSLWGMPYPIIEAVAYHQAPWEVTHESVELVDIVFIANLLARELESGAAQPALEHDHLAVIGLADRLDEFRARAKELVS